MEVVSFPWGILVGAVVLQISAAPEDLPGRLSLNGQVVCEVASVRSRCTLDLGPTPRVHELVLEDRQGRVKERVWLNRGPWRPRVLLEPEACDPSYLCFRVNGGHPEKELAVSFQVKVGSQRWSFGPNEVAKIPRPGEGSVLVVHAEFADGSATEHAAIVGPTLFSEVADTTAGFVLVKKAPGLLPASLCSQLVLGEERAAPPAVVFVLEPGALRRLRFWAKQAQAQPRGFKELGLFNPADAKVWDAAEGALRGVERVIVLGTFGSLPQLGPTPSSSGPSTGFRTLGRLLLASQAADAGSSQRRRTADAVAVAAFHLATHPGPRAVVLVRGDEARDESVFALPDVRQYLRELMVPLVVWSSREVAPAGWPQGRQVRSLGDLAAATRELACLLQEQTVIWLEGGWQGRRCQGDWPSTWRVVGDEPGGPEPRQPGGVSSGLPPQDVEKPVQTGPRAPAFWVRLGPASSPAIEREWIVQVGGAVQKVRRAWRPQEGEDGRFPCFALNSQFLTEAAAGSIKKFLLDHLKAFGSLCVLDLQGRALEPFRTRSAAELKEWLRKWERGLAREDRRQKLRDGAKEQQTRLSKKSGGAGNAGVASSFLAQELNLVRRSLGSLLLACEAISPPATLVVISGGLDLHPERYYARFEQVPRTGSGGFLTDTAQEIGESLASRGCLTFALVVGQGMPGAHAPAWGQFTYEAGVSPRGDAVTRAPAELSDWQAVAAPTGGKAETLDAFRWKKEIEGFFAVELEAHGGKGLEGPLKILGAPDAVWSPKYLQARTHPLVGEQLAWQALRGEATGSLPIKVELLDPVEQSNGSGVGLLRVTLPAPKRKSLPSGEVGRLTVCVVCPGVLPAFSAIPVEAPRASWVLESEIHWTSNGCTAGVAVEIWPLGVWGGASVKLKP